MLGYSPFVTGTQGWALHQGGTADNSKQANLNPARRATSQFITSRVMISTGEAIRSSLIPLTKEEKRNECEAHVVC